MLPTFPIAVACSWHRSLLGVAGFLNVLAPVVRYFAAQAGAYEVVLLTNFLLGNAFGVLGVWPAMLAAVHWREQRRAVVIAIAGLSNYVGGAAGVLFFPTFANTAEELLNVFEVQAYVSIVLGVLMVTWCWLPPFHEGVLSMRALEGVLTDPHSTSSSSSEPQHRLTLKQELGLCLRGQAPFQVVSFGVLVGVSLALQGISPYIFSSLGFSAVNSGLSNACYQLSAAVVGVGLGAKIQNQRHLRLALRALHLIMIISMMAIIVLCSVVRSSGVYLDASAAIVVLMILLGGSLMGALPFCIQQLLYTAHPVSENVVSGCLYLIAAPLAATLTQISTFLDPIVALWIILILLVLQTLIFMVFGPKKLSQIAD